MILKLQDENSPVAEIQRKLGIADDGHFGVKTDAALRHFQAEKGLHVDGIAGKNTLDALGLSHIAKYQIGGSDKSVAWELPKSGTGFRTYNRESYGDQFARKETIEKLVKIAADWHEIHPEIDIQIGDLSRIYGGVFINPLTNKREHGTHRTGKDSDVRPFRKDGAYNRVDCREAEYSRELSREFLKMVKSRCRVIYFNDATLIKEGLCAFSSGHFDHFHLSF